MKSRSRVITVFACAVTFVSLVPANPAFAAGTLSGTITDPEGRGVAGVAVNASAVSGPSTGGDTTDANGAFTITGLDAGDHTVRFVPADVGATVIDGIYLEDAFLRTQHWPGVESSDDAEPVTIVDGATVTLDYTLIRRPVILGRVEDSAGNPVNGRVDVHDSSSNVVASGYTDDGAFGATFDPASVALQAWPDADRYATPTVWYDGTEGFADAQRFDLDYGDLVSDVTLTFESPKTLGGRIVRSSINVDGWVAELYDLDGDLIATGESIGADGGGWSIDNVPSGQFKVLVYQPDPQGSDALFGWFPVWYGGAPLHRFDRAAVITVNDQSVFGLDVEMQELYPDMFESIFIDDIAWMQFTGVTTGCGAAGFCPQEEVTRGQMAAFLVRALGLQSVTPSVAFDDTGASVFEQDIRRLATVGITRGCSATSFCPDDQVTRAQMAAFLVRAMGYTDRGSTDFTDDDGSVFEADIEKLAAAGVTTGCSTTEFCPDDAVTRGQMAAFLRRALGGVLYPEWSGHAPTADLRSR